MEALKKLLAAKGKPRKVCEALVKCCGCGNTRLTINGCMPKVCGGCGSAKFTIPDRVEVF